MSFVWTVFSEDGFKLRCSGEISVDVLGSVKLRQHAIPNKYYLLRDSSENFAEPYIYPATGQWDYPAGFNIELLDGYFTNDFVDYYTIEAEEAVIEEVVSPAGLKNDVTRIIFTFKKAICP